MPRLQRLSTELGIADQVDFRGTIREGRGRELARHKVMVVPSTWAEPFGVVALEGLGAGCVLAASNEGGLPEAVGRCGLLFPKGNAEALAAAVKRLLTDARLRATLLAARSTHLARFQPETIAHRYLEIFESVLRN
jgi:glycosyltransferase involved in cell wall biosynthesis